MVESRAYDVISDEGFPVRMPSGAEFYVITQSEAEYFNERVRRYENDYKFTSVSDQQDIDKMVILELFMHRWSLWLSRHQDYYGQDIDTKDMAARVENTSKELRLLKKNLGIDKPARDRQRGDDSVAAYLENLRRRAKEFGIMRNEQFYKTIELFQQLKALIQYYDNQDEQERHESHTTMEDVVRWIREVAIPEFDAIDSKFKKEKQSTWVRNQ